MHAPNFSSKPVGLPSDMHTDVARAISPGSTVENFFTTSTATPYLTELPCALWLNPLQFNNREFNVYSATILQFGCPCAAHSAQRAVSWKKSGPFTEVKGGALPSLAGLEQCRLMQQIAVGKSYSSGERIPRLKSCVARVTFVLQAAAFGGRPAGYVHPWHHLVQVVAAGGLEVGSPTSIKGGGSAMAALTPCPPAVPHLRPRSAASRPSSAGGAPLPSPLPTSQRPRGQRRGSSASSSTGGGGGGGSASGLGLLLSPDGGYCSKLLALVAVTPSVLQGGDMVEEDAEEGWGGGGPAAAPRCRWLPHPDSLSSRGPMQPSPQGDLCRAGGGVRSTEWEREGEAGGGENWWGEEGEGEDVFEASQRPVSILMQFMAPHAFPDPAPVPLATAAPPTSSSSSSSSSSPSSSSSSCASCSSPLWLSGKHHEPAPTYPQRFLSTAYPPLSAAGFFTPLRVDGTPPPGAFSSSLYSSSAGTPFFVPQPVVLPSPMEIMEDGGGAAVQALLLVSLPPTRPRT